MALVTDALVCPGQSLEPILQSITVEEPRPDEAIVENHAVGVCHTDVACMHGKIPTNLPAVLGHEAAKIVDWGIRRTVRAMQLKTLGGQREDGTKSLTLTDSGAKLSSHFFGQSSFAEIALVSGRCMVKVPESTNLALFAPLVCGIQTGAGTVLNTLDVKEDQSLAAFGVGAVGLSCIMAAKLRAASPIITIDVNQARLELAKELGATNTILSGDKTLDVPEEIRRISGGNGVFRAADCSGIPVVIEQMIKSLGSRGKATTVGSPAPGVCAKIDIFSAHCEGDTLYWIL
ncbi:related to zinc-containing long-chain alcohol dehydrogenase [Fusarium oxysporum]|uniref:Related to zinc-containing long-chain alcohol dehydrogenase n=1 Tax=Fusarium oxysporum TaxID=5507 RepID=A0A2H3TFS9_FUSOX|nr:related to zinc-containing long-chain alcohol dehydrogenase [Fusarium oxysporum]